MRSRDDVPMTVRLGLLALVAFGGLAVAILAVWSLMAGPHGQKPKLPAPTAQALPPIEPLEVRAIARADAIAINAERPFSNAPNPAATPVRLIDDGTARALACLTAAVYYEAAGEGVDGERAVAQVVLNRMRHPAYPKSVCGVVFQGSERRTGCQFTFTCDGALARTPSPGGWRMASAVAQAALTGYVFKPVGYATHYHTDWVVPVWRTSLDKIVKIGTHIFYRWAGGWGRPAAFRNISTTTEAPMAALAALAPGHAEAPPATAALPETMATAAAELSASPAPSPPGAAAAPPAKLQIVNLALEARGNPDSFVQIARFACGSAQRCEARGWTDAASVAKTSALTGAQEDRMSFSFVRDGASERASWNCREFRDREPRTCLKVKLLIDLQQDRTRIAPQ